MLKNKKAIYLLIPLNLAVWGFFIYRFWAAYHEGDVPQQGQQIQTAAFKNSRDSSVYRLTLNYKDPFLKEDGKSVTHPFSETNGSAPVIRRQPAPAAKTIVNEPPKQLPELKYLGLIKNTSSGLVTALVMVNGQSRLIKPNESMDGFFFKSFNKDSLVARYGQEKIVVTK